MREDGFVMTNDNAFLNFARINTHSPNPEATDEVVDLSIRLFGEGAATAIAFCALDARLNGDDHCFRIWVKAFRRFQN